MSEQARHLYEFGPFLLDTAERRLLRDGQPVPLSPKAFETLLVLVERSGHLVGKDELMSAVWPDSYVEEANLNHHVWALRKALGDGSNGSRYIETVPRHGYRFAVGVRELTGAGEDALVVEKHTLTRVVTLEDETAEDDRDAIAQVPEQRLLGAGKEKRTRWKIVAAALCLLAVAGLLALYRPWQREAAKPEASVLGQPQLNSIAVLPFKAIGAESEDEYLSLGLADALITRLGNVREIVVRPTSAVRRYTDANQDPATIGRQQGVDAVLDGSFQRQGDRLRLTVQLIRVADGATLWSAQFDERFTDIFSVQDSISERVACDLVTRICGEEAGRPAKQKPVNIEAYEAYLKGRYFWNKRTRDGFRKAVEYFKQAIEIDPTYARAYAGLGDAYGYLGGDDPAAQAESAAKAKAGARRALELDETLGEAHASLGLYAMNNDWDWAEAEKEFKRAIELNPNYATAHQWYGEFLVYMGRFDEAIREIERAHELDPLSLIISTDVAKVYGMARRYDEAIAQYKRTLDVDPDFAEARALLALTYSMKGQHAEAAAELLKVKDLENNPPYLSWLVYAYGQAGRMDEARRVLKRVKDLSKQTYVSPLWMAFAHLGLGEKDQAFAWFEKVFAERSSGGGVTLKVNPFFDSLRPDPRFQDLMRRAGFNT